jgi:hypothetical protein
VLGIVSHAITRDLSHDRTENVMGNLFSQTDDHYQPAPALQLVPLPRLRVTLCEAGHPGMYHAKERSTCQTPT